MIEISGQWYPFGVSQRRPALLRTQGDRFEIWEEGSDAPVVASRSQVRLSAPLGRTNRRLEFASLGTLEVADSDRIAQVFPESRTSLEGWLHRLEQHRVAIVTGIVLVAASLALFLQFGVPAIADGVARRLPHSVETRLADQTWMILRKIGIGESRTPAVEQARLQAAFRQMVVGEPRASQMRLQFVSAGKLGPNAFAIPDGRLTVTDELIEAVDHDEGRILAVLAHEAGHHVHYHGTRFAIESAGIAGILGWVLGDVAGTGMLASIPPALLQARFSRKHETEADDYAFALLRKRNISPAKFADALEAIQASIAKDDDSPGAKAKEPKSLEFFSSHPAAEERIARARELAKDGASAQKP